MKVVSQPSIFSCYVSFRECISLCLTRRIWKEVFQYPFSACLAKSGSSSPHPYAQIKQNGWCLDFFRSEEHHFQKKGFSRILHHPLKNGSSTNIEPQNCESSHLPKKTRQRLPRKKLSLWCWVSYQLVIQWDDWTQDQLVIQSKNNELVKKMQVMGPQRFHLKVFRLKFLSPKTHGKNLVLCVKFSKFGSVKLIRKRIYKSPKISSEKGRHSYRIQNDWNLFAKKRLANHFNPKKVWINIDKHSIARHGFVYFV